MINPFEITNYHRNENELQEFLLFAIIVAGKTAYIQAKKLELFLSEAKNKYNLQYSEPFTIIKTLYDTNLLQYHIEDCKIGQYKKIYNSFSFLANSKLDLKTCNINDLEKIPGVGPKTSRFFLLHSRKQKIAVLDVHILKWLASIGYDKVPKTTPSNKSTYLYWENIFLKYCEENNKDPAQLDLEIWKKFAKKERENENNF